MYAYLGEKMVAMIAAIDGSYSEMKGEVLSAKPQLSCDSASKRLDLWILTQYSGKRQVETFVSGTTREICITKRASDFADASRFLG